MRTEHRVGIKWSCISTDSDYGERRRTALIRYIDNYGSTPNALERPPRA